MALRTILNFSDEALRRKARDVERFDDKLGVLLDDMAETMAQHNGVGLAAPQVGINRRVITVNVGDGLIELVNPVVSHMKGYQRELEGCLSSPGEWGYVPRPEKVVVKAQDRFGKPLKVDGDGLLSIALMHEIDHLNGILFVDLADEMVDEKEAEIIRSERNSRLKRKGKRK